MPEIVYVLIERSLAGDTVVGVYTTLEAARAQLPPFESGRLFDFSILAQVVDEAPAPAAWRAVVDARGVLRELAPFIQCSSCPPPEASYEIDPADGSLQAVLWALTPGEAGAMARELQTRLLQKQPA